MLRDYLPQKSSNDFFFQWCNLSPQTRGQKQFYIFFSFVFAFYFVLFENLGKQPRLSLNLQPSCLSVLNASITGHGYDIQLAVLLLFSQLALFSGAQTEILCAHTSIYVNLGIHVSQCTRGGQRMTLGAGLSLPLFETGSPCILCEKVSQLVSFCAFSCLCLPPGCQITEIMAFHSSKLQTHILCLYSNYFKYSPIKPALSWLVFDRIYPPPKLAQTCDPPCFSPSSSIDIASVCQHAML